MKEDLQLTAIKIMINLIQKGIYNKIYNQQEIIMFNGCINIFTKPEQKQKLTTIKEEEEEKIDD